MDISRSPWLLSSSSLIFLLVSLLSVFFLIMKNRKKPLANLPPSPPTLPIIGNLHQLGKIPHLSLHNLSKKHGPVMLLKLGRIPTLVVSSPEMAKQVLFTHDLDFCSRPYSYGPNRLSYNSSDLVFGPYSEYWKEMRKLCVTELFTVKRVKSFWHVRDEKVSQMMDSLSQVCGSSVNLSEKIFDHTNSIICNIAFGKSYEGNQFASGKFQETIDGAMAVLSSFWATDFFPYIGWMADVIAGRHRRLEECFHKLDGFFERVIEEHLDPAWKRAQNEDIVDILLAMMSKKDDNSDSTVRISRDNIKALLMNIFIGAIDTSSLTMVWAMSELARNPRVMKKAQAEITRVVGRKPKVAETELDKIKYLKMVVKETLRLHPPATLLVPRESMRHCKIGGYDIYPKTRVFVGAWSIGRDPKTWKDPEEFFPERFDGSDIDFRGQNFELLPFGAGRRICPGMAMANATIELTLANLLLCFEWELPPGMETKDIDMEEEAGLTVHKKSPLYLVPIKYKWGE